MRGADQRLPSAFPLPRCVGGIACGVRKPEKPSGRSRRSAPGASGLQAGLDVHLIRRRETQARRGRYPSWRAVKVHSTLSRWRQLTIGNHLVAPCRRSARRSRRPSARGSRRRRSAGMPTVRRPSRPQADLDHRVLLVLGQLAGGRPPAITRRVGEDRLTCPTPRARRRRAAQASPPRLPPLLDSAIAARSSPRSARCMPSPPLGQEDPVPMLEARDSLLHSRHDGYLPGALSTSL